MEVFGLCPVAPEVSWLIPFLEMRLFANDKSKDRYRRNGKHGAFSRSGFVGWQSRGGELVAVASTSPHKLKEYGEQRLKVFGGGEEMIQSEPLTQLSSPLLIISMFP